MEENIKFSILTPVYNVEKYIHNCINSVLNQTYSNFEFILVDDGSKDNSGNICDEYSKKDNRIKVIHKANEGLLTTRRRAFEEATGEYYVVLDSDDCLETNALEIISKTIMNYKCDMVIYGFQRKLNEDIISIESENTLHPFVIEDKRELYKRFFLSNTYNALWRKAFKATLLDGRSYSKYYGIDIAEDLLQSVEIIKNSKCTVFIPDVLYNYTINPNSITRDYSYKTYKINLLIYDYVLNFLKDEGVFKSKDYADLKSYYVRDVVSHLIIISGFDTQYKNKIALFEKIKETDLYKSFLSSKEYGRFNSGLRGIIFRAFLKGKYKRVIFISKIADFLKRLKNKKIK